jgi:hypothetical protein
MLPIVQCGVVLVLLLQLGDTLGRGGAAPNPFSFRRGWNRAQQLARTDRPRGWKRLVKLPDSVASSRQADTSLSERKWRVMISATQDFQDMLKNWLYWYELCFADLQGGSQDSLPLILVADDQFTYDTYKVGSTVVADNDDQFTHTTLTRKTHVYLTHLVTY